MGDPAVKIWHVSRTLAVPTLALPYAAVVVAPDETAARMRTATHTHYTQKAWAMANVVEIGEYTGPATLAFVLMVAYGPLA